MKNTNLILKQHNLQAYLNVIKLFETSNSALVEHPKGTGKKYIALKLILDNIDKKVLYISTTNTKKIQFIKEIQNYNMTRNDIKQVENITYKNLSKLTKEDIKKEFSDISYIVLDEFNNSRTRKWLKSYNMLIKQNENVKVLGLSSIPINCLNSMRNIIKNIFNNNIASSISLEETIIKRILPKLNYISAIYDYSDIIKRLQAAVETSKITVQEKKEFNKKNIILEKYLQNEVNKIPDILKTNIKNRMGKYIVFCADKDVIKEEMENCQAMFSHINENIEIYTETLIDLSFFKNNNSQKTIKLLFLSDISDKEYYLNGVDGIIMFSSFKDINSYKQQLAKFLSMNQKNDFFILELVKSLRGITLIKDLEFDFYNKFKKDEKNNINCDYYNFKGIAFEITELINEITIKLNINFVTISKKIELIKEYYAENNTAIKTTTEFKGEQIGIIKNRIRQKYKNGSLKATNEEIQELKKLGILDFTPILKKDLELIKEYYAENNTAIKTNTEFKEEQIDTIKNRIRRNYKSGSLKTTNE